MKSIKSSISILALAAITILGHAQVTDPELHRMTADGPYIIYKDNGLARVISVSPDGSVIDTTGIVPQSFRVVSHDGQFEFDVKLREHSRQEWQLPSTGRTFILSDPHGRLDCLVSILRAGGVVDEQLNWAFGPHRLVLIGDVMDRGDDVTQIYWLLYKLQAEAAEAGGSLSMVYGNHEAMVLGGDLRYCREKYKALADSTGLTVPLLYGRDTELGRWIGEFNTMMKVGDDLFVHAGTSAQLLDLGMGIAELNEFFSEGIFLSSKERKAHSETMYKLYKSAGPIWYRGFFYKNEKYGGKMDHDTLDRILECYGASRIFVGHSIFKRIHSFYKGKVVDVDVDAKLNRDAGRDRAVLLDGPKEYVIRDSGKKHPLR